MQVNSNRKQLIFITKSQFLRDETDYEIFVTVSFIALDRYLKFACTIINKP
jgi:hypothetical protein